MPNEWALPELTTDDDPALYAYKLRCTVFSTAQEAAEQFHVNKSTISRYEDRERTPPVGYLASFSRLALAAKLRAQQETADGAAPQKLLLEQLNTLLWRYPADFKEHAGFANWAELGRAADDFEQRKTGAIFGSLPLDADPLGGVLPVSSSGANPLLLSMAAASGSAPPLPALLIGRDNALPLFNRRLGPAGPRACCECRRARSSTPRSRCGTSGAARPTGSASG